MKDYRTVHTAGTAEIVESKSRFMAVAGSVNSERDCAEFLESVRKRNYSASHNTYAYRLIGGTADVQRYSDGGEPSGTAGMPILNVLAGEKLFNAMIVVTRYFGGVLLGTGGLVRVYTAAAKAAVADAVIIEKKHFVMYDIKIPYTLHGKMKHVLETKGFIINGTQ